MTPRQERAAQARDTLPVSAPSRAGAALDRAGAMMTSATRRRLAELLAAAVLADLRRPASESAEPPASGASSPGNARTVVGTLHRRDVTALPAPEAAP